MGVVVSILFVIAVIAGILALFVSIMFYRASEDDYPVIKEFQINCPKCTDVKHERIYRKWWMRFIPGTTYYRCDRCRSKFVIILWRSALKIS
jgi:hypothetical protein